MSRSHRIYFSTAVLLIASMACAVPAVPAIPDTATPVDLNTAIAQTVSALTMNAPSETASPTQEATATFTLELSTATSTETATAMLELTSTLSITLISVSVDTNCRNGPGKVFENKGFLLVGESVEVFGVDPTNSYWYIRNPDSSAEFCWVWGKYATVTGPTSQLPIHTPPPTPEFTSTPMPTLTPTSPPTFDASYIRLDTCNGQWWVEIKLLNTSSVSFKSIHVSVKDKSTNETQVHLQNGFAGRDGCEEGNTKDRLAPGDTYRIDTPAFSHNLASHEIKVTITLCSGADLQGFCSTRGVGVIP